MKKSTFRVLACEAPKSTIALFAQKSSNLTIRQRARILQLVGGAA